MQTNQSFQLEPIKFYNSDGLRRYRSTPSNQRTEELADILDQAPHIERREGEWYWDEIGGFDNYPWDYFETIVNLLGDNKFREEAGLSLAAKISSEFGPKKSSKIGELIETKDYEALLKIFNELFGICNSGLSSDQLIDEIHKVRAKFVLCNYQDGKGIMRYFLRGARHHTKTMHLTLVGAFLNEVQEQGVDLNQLKLEQSYGHGSFNLFQEEDLHLKVFGGAHLEIDQDELNFKDKHKKIILYGKSKALGSWDRAYDSSDFTEEENKKIRDAPFGLGTHIVASVLLKRYLVGHNLTDWKVEIAGI